MAVSFTYLTRFSKIRCLNSKVTFSLTTPDNSAHNGGVISTSRSQLSLSYTTFEYNLAYYGGAIALDTASYLYADHTQFLRNTAVNTGGCILALTDTYFTINKGFFYKN